MNEEESRNYNQMRVERASREAAADSARLLEVALARIKQIELLLYGLSNTVTALCEAIDPNFNHGPETEKIAHHARTTRRLAEELAHGVFVGNRTFQTNKAREVLNHLEVQQPLNGGICLAVEDALS